MSSPSDSLSIARLELLMAAAIESARREVRPRDAGFEVPRADSAEYLATKILEAAGRLGWVVTVNERVAQ